MARKKTTKKEFNYSKDESFKELQAVQQMALNKRGKDDEINPDISIYLKAEELKGKLCGLYSDKEKSSSSINMMGSVKIDGANLNINVGENLGTKDD